MNEETKTKEFSADMSIEDGSREMKVRITSGVLDREGEVLLPNGMMVEEYMKNPIVFANHSYGVRDVVGKVVSMKKQAGAWLAKVFMLPRPDNHVGEWLPDTILHNARFGIMGVSVGFTAEHGGTRQPTKKDREDFGDQVRLVYARWKLLELSIAPLPANQEALILAVAKGMKREVVQKFYPKVTLPPERKRVSLAGMVKHAWKSVVVGKAVERGVSMELAKRRGRIYFDD